MAANVDASLACSEISEVIRILNIKSDPSRAAAAGGTGLPAAPGKVAVRRSSPPPRLPLLSSPLLSSHNNCVGIWDQATP
jgi:hypothetical protein